ncbi:succinyl-diaminopimelate desuccinylase [Amycolatopsis mediterranei S699]|uniref:Succinyl-diaminopimelate desuccinylase n=2 Tax=Amycolatopsis mediterranei TaxID=33910 RepID=A0A0H3D017_AMYMU|nr:succinyl-diaminopimelate desuccinylase [Amycolatopsis mediterranei]ADJ42851.1 succinyl-diaminopimelate desuccinylase [Amycolatopsis mediterranei U32]AEK39543.1 succinyl-diaminopimelate desuccinylase [Amycolatopsis mediterranei S699]AFO74565.1 succinyl-diaminopimelate desuccinylase [Amycolatopsis mediterranei S699]AGT81694.1 succinyl-diaminopimelate desuccinylase [Amycolatopsis mediterranei RB]KDO10144.1 succinyl-diaminopimelate desuccinylase [Amycolatopsis mediterranei]
MSLDLHADPVDLTTALVDIFSVSGAEAEIATAVQEALQAQAPHLEVVRNGDAVLARTDLGRGSRVVLAGHLDTVPENGNLPSRREGTGDEEILHGLGTVDMKGGDAVFLHLAATLPSPKHDITFVFYDNEEVEAVKNGLGRIERELPEWLAGDLAIVGEPSNGVIEAGCQGTMRVELRLSGKRAHTARAWMGENAIHALAEPLRRLAEYTPRIVDIDGLTYREGLQATSISGGVAGNVVPDAAVLTVNHRFAPDRDPAAAERHLREVFDGFELSVVDLSPGALPGLSAPAAAELVTAAGGRAAAKLGWTDVARFAARGMPAVNFGPGNPTLAHTKQENVRTAEIRQVTEVLRKFLA